MAGPMSRSNGEWTLMYRKGLAVARIAQLCRIEVEQVSRAVAWAKRRDPSLQAEHESYAPAPDELQPPALGRHWASRRDELAEFIATSGRAPYYSGGDPAEISLGRWVAKQRLAAKNGTLVPELREALDATGNWQDTGRAQRDEQRWQEALLAFAAFVGNEGHLPSYKHPADETERRLGTWLHGQRQLEAEGKLPEIRSAALKQAVPHWYTWRKRR